jgi:50S ribosomal subunit-associated GTPase HflX
MLSKINENKRLNRSKLLLGKGKKTKIAKKIKEDTINIAILKKSLFRFVILFP